MISDPLTVMVWIMSLATIPVVLFFVLRAMIKRNSRHAAAVSALHCDETGAMTVPVLATFTGIRGLHSLVAVAANSLNPAFVIRPGHIDYRVILARSVRFEDIESVRTFAGPGTLNLVFTFTGGPFTFSANVMTLDVAESVLAAYPALAAKRR